MKKTGFDELTIALEMFRASYLETYPDEWCQTYYDINSGNCVDFADSFIETYAEIFGEDLTSYENENFLRYDEEGEPFYNGDSYEWDVPLLETHWSACKPLYDLSWGEYHLFAGDYHVFLFYQGRFFDAECPEGVENLFELPIYERKAKHLIQQKIKSNL